MTLTKTARGARLRGLAAASALTACALATLATPRTVLAASIDQIQQQIKETSTAYDEANARVESVQAQIDANEQRIAQIEEILPGKRAVAADSIRLLYKMQQGTGGLLDLLLSSEDFNSLISTIQYLDVIQSHNYDAVSELASLDAELQQTRSDLATQQAAAESDRQAASDALAAAKAARTELEQQMAEQAAAEEAERLGVSESAPVAKTAQRYYAALLQSRLRTLFECKKQNVYIETQTAFVTVYKASAEHALVLSAGGYDVAGKRMENDLAVDGGWVQRKNPDFIVKFVAASALNGDTLGELLARDGLRETAAAKNGRALLLCESMTDAPQLQTAAALCLAKAMYPDLFADIDAAQAVGQLADEAGAQTGGPWFYPAI